MRVLSVFIALALSAAAFAAPVDRCNKHAIGQHANYVAQAGLQLEQVVEHTHGYENLDLDAHRLHTQAEELARFAGQGYPCAQLDNLYHALELTFQALTQQHNQAQAAYPNATVYQYFRNLSSAIHTLDSAVHAPATLTTSLVCASGNYQYKECYIGGQIVNAWVAAQLSSARCVQGSTWGVRGNVIWVNRGCRANFGVQYIPHAE